MKVLRRFIKSISLVLVATVFSFAQTRLQKSVRALHLRQTSRLRPRLQPLRLPDRSAIHTRRCGRNLLR